MTSPSTPSPAQPARPGGRRLFLFGAAAAAVPAAFFFTRGGSGLLSPAADAPLPGGMHRLEDYSPLVGTAFTEAGSGHALTLAKAEPIASRASQAGPYAQCTLSFTPSTGQTIENRSYLLDHPVLGRVELFLTPVGSCIRFGEAQKGEAVLSYPRQSV